MQTAACLRHPAYSGGTTPPASFSYDQASVTIGSWSSGTLTNPNGRMTEAATTVSGSVNTAVAYSYDPVGRIASFWQCNNASNCSSQSPLYYTTTYSYDWGGDVIKWAHPGSINLTNSVNSAQQVTAVQTTSQYTNLPQTLVQNVTYTPWGAVSVLQNGCVGSQCVNAQENYQYNKLLQPWVISLTAASGAGYCLVYNYFAAGWTPPTTCPSASSTPPTGTTDDGNVMGYWYEDSVNSSFSHTASYTYDGVNRLSSACTLSGSQCATSGSNVYNLAFAYDQFGNMHCTGGVGGGSAIGYCPAWTYNTSTNQLTTSGFSYDAAGNLTKDSSNATAHTYQWDAEGRVASVDNGATWGFTYNALGERVQWTYSNGAGANQHMFDPNGGWLGIYGVLDVLRWGDGAYAWYNNGSETYFNHVNNVGSTTMLTNHAGAEVEDMLFYPWGDAWQSQGSGGYNFAELPYYDGNTNTSPSMFRFYSMGLGRWHSPDPAGGDISNPQSLNRYAYVLNNPTTLTDPLGLQGGCPPGSEQAGMCRNGTFYPPGGPVYPWNPFTNPGSWGWNWDEFDLMGIRVYSGQGFSEGWPVAVNQVGYAADYFDSYQSGGAGGGCGTPGLQKIAQVVNSALHQPKLSECLNKLFGPGNILNNQNLPILDTRQSEATISVDTKAAAYATYATPVPATGRGTVLMASEYFNSIGSFEGLQATFLHETANILAIQRNQHPVPKNPAALLGDNDAGAALEECMYGHLVY
ncbi:MAG: RHS repeat-associated core domain-containing protein [Terriglobia bacterium]|jgi:RHS repeat-associated protein